MPREELNRKTILEGRMRRIAEQQPGLVRLMSDEDRDRWVQRVVSEAPDRGAMWVFGYGSLIWNPAFHWCEKRRGEVYGYNRSFCMWTKLGRGTEVETELDIVFRRELLSYAYIPTWVDVRCDAGDIRAITFVMDQTHERHVKDIDEETMVRHLATAIGPLGPNCEYLYDLVEHLDLLAYFQFRNIVKPCTRRSAVRFSRYRPNRCR